MEPSENERAPSSDSQHIGREMERVLETVQTLAAELHPGRSPGELDLNSRLDTVVGFDSLSFLELRDRLEAEFKMTIPDDVFTDGLTPRDWLLAIATGLANRVGNEGLDSGVPEVVRDVVASVPLSGAKTLPDVFEVHTGMHPRRRRLRVKRAAGFAYGLYAYGVAVILASACWPVLVILPVSLRLRWSFVRGAGNMLRWLVGISLTISGDMPDGEPVLVVANHASIVDGLVIILAARKPLTFLVGAVFGRQRLVGRFLSGLGCVFVDSASGSDAVVLTDRFTAMLKQDRSIMSFPEGGLELTPGLREFHLGAFRAAINAHVPVIPVGISGTRSIVAPGTRLPRRSAVHVVIGSPICVHANDWKSLIALREAAFSAVAALSCRPA